MRQGACLRENKGHTLAAIETYKAPIAVVFKTCAYSDMFEVVESTFLQAIETTEIYDPKKLTRNWC